MQKKIDLIMILITALCTSTIAKQDVYFSVKSDSVFLFLSETPGVGQGIHVERKGQEEKEFVRLTQEPIRPVLAAAEVSQMLGDDYTFIARAIHVENAQQMLLLLRNDPFYGGVFIMLNHKVGKILGRFFKAGSHKKNTTYVYRIITVDRAGDIVEQTEKSIPIIEHAPIPPKQLACKQTAQAIEITWQYPKWEPGKRDLTVQFYLYRKSESTEYQKINDLILLRLEGMQFIYKDINAEHGITYTYMITAIDACGLESEPSNEVTITSQDILPPSSPKGLVTTVNDGNVELIWFMNPELDVTHYNIYRSIGLRNPLEKINTLSVLADLPAYTDSCYQEGRQYFYAVTAVDSNSNESEPCNRVDAWPEDKTPPAPPTNLNAHVENRTVFLTWNAPVDQDLKGYLVLRGFSETTQFRRTEEMITVTQYEDRDGIDPGDRYYYKVVALDSVQNRSEPVGVWVAIPDDQPPGQPGDIRVENDYGRGLIVTWNSSTSLDVEWYHVVRKIGDVENDFGDFSPKDREFYDSTAVKGKTYIYKITAIDSAGNISQPRQSIPILVQDYQPPPQPSFTAVQEVQNGIRIYWERVASFDLVGYNVYRSDLETGVFEKITIKPVTGLEYIDLKGTTRNWYRIKSVDTSGNESNPSKPVKVVQ